MNKNNITEEITKGFTHQEIKVLIAVGLVCILLGMLLGVGLALIPEKKCVSNPLNYATEVYGSYSCNCWSNKGFETSTFYLNKTGVFPR